MDDIYVVKQAEQLRGLTDPLRLAILGEAMDGPVTIALVAKALGENPRKLYYHFTELERLGLLRVVEARQKGNLLERWYEAVARFISVDWALFSEGSEGRDALVESVTALLHNSALHFRRRMGTGEVTPEQVGQVWPLHQLLRLRPDQIPALRDRLRAALEEFRDAAESSGDPTASLTLLFYPFTPAATDESPNPASRS